MPTGMSKAFASLFGRFPKGRAGLQAQHLQAWLGNGRVSSGPLEVEGSEAGDSGDSYWGFIWFSLKSLKPNTTMTINFLPKTVLQSI